MTLPRPKAIIFDWDNTLVNTWPVIHAALHHTFTQMGQEPWSIETTMRRVRKSMRDSFPEIFGPEWEKAGAIYQQHYRSNHLTTLQPLPGAEDLLKRIRAAGLVCVVVSNKKGPNLRQEITHLGWDQYFDRIVGSDDAARDKPHVDPVHMALEGTGIQPGKDVWFVGDSDIDLECARNTGCTPLLYGDIVTAQPEFDPNGTYMGFSFHKHARDHETLWEILEKMIAQVVA